MIGQARDLIRFIPTHVGLTVHGRDLVDVHVGSSPRTWGLQKNMRPQCPLRAVHPHARGAYNKCGKMPDFKMGSSPRTWGLRTRRPDHHYSASVHPHARGAYSRRPCDNLADDRFIPTHVGLTPKLSYPQKIITVHPHARGAYHKEETMEHKTHGSSPRTWGLH